MWPIVNYIVNYICCTSTISFCFFLPKITISFCFLFFFHKNKIKLSLRNRPFQILIIKKQGYNLEGSLLHNQYSTIFCYSSKDHWKLQLLQDQWRSFGFLSPVLMDFCFTYLLFNLFLFLLFIIYIFLKSRKHCLRMRGFII